MKRLMIGLIAVCVSMLSALPVSAEIGFTEDGKVYSISPYTGAGFDMDDVKDIAIGAVAGASVFGLAQSLLRVDSLITAVPLTVLYWGAARTNRYRSDVAKNIIRANIEARKEAEKLKGTVWAL